MHGTTMKQKASMLLSWRDIGGYRRASARSDARRRSAAPATAAQSILHLLVTAHSSGTVPELFESAMSNIAPPIPALLKEVKHGKGQYAKRLENKDRLLRWAIEYLDTTTNYLIACNREPSGKFEPNVKVEIQRCQKWLKLARASQSSIQGWRMNEFPTPADDAYIARLRTDYPEICDGKSDEEVMDYYNPNGHAYVEPTLWDHLGDASYDYKKLADAYLALQRSVANPEGNAK
jgi:hypothetical protein